MAHDIMDLKACGTEWSSRQSHLATNALAIPHGGNIEKKRLSITRLIHSFVIKGSQFYTCLNYPLHEKLNSLTRIIDQSSANKDLQALFPQLINNIFASSFSNGWGLRTVTFETSRYEYELLISFLEPQGPMFRLCYKLLSDPQLKYNLPLNALPMDLQITLERGRSSQFYSDMLATDAQAVNIVALALNPFDFYIFNFALHLVSHSQNKSSWENWNSAYFALACDYLMHFLPADPNMPVLPHIPNYTGKVHMAAPLQTANRPFSQHTPSLLIIPDLPGLSNQHAPPQNQSRNEVWRSETVLHVFMDIWMCVEQFNARSVEMYQRNYAITNSSPERVRTVRVLVKHMHSFSANLSDPASRSCALRKYARQIMSARAYHYVKHLVTTWPLDASFRLVMELWLSLIQPWRYTDNVISQERFPNANNNQEEVGLNALDASFTQFIAENYPAYTCIFQLVLPRFVMLDLTSYKNAVMLFRLGKVFSQPQLVNILKGLEKAVTLNSSGFYYPCPDSSYNSSALDQSYSYNGMALQKWVAVAKQAISELNLSTNFEYDPIWTENKKHSSLEFVKKIIAAKLASEKNVAELNTKVNQQQQGFWAGIKHWLMLGGSIEDELALEECKKVPTYLNATIHFFTDIFGLQEASLMQLDPVVEDISEHSSFANSSQFPLSITNKLRNKSKSIDYMGDPDLMPITTYENTILIRMFHQLATRLNEVYQQEFSSIWSRTDFWGYVAREVLQKPRAIRTYVRDASSRPGVATRLLPARLSLRRLGSHAFVAWFIIGAVTMRIFFDCGCLLYTFLIFIMWASFVITKASFKLIRIMS